MTRKDLLKICDSLAPFVAKEGCELIDADLVFESCRKILRLYIDRPGGVGLHDCERVSHAVEDVLEVEQVVPGSYRLEVSSPGLNRPLRKPEHFQAAVGRRVHVVTCEKIGGRRNFRGILKRVENNSVVLAADQDDFNIAFFQIFRAHLVGEEGT